MPIDPSIALNANAPQPTNPLQTALSIAQYRMANAQGNALQQQIGANQATSKAIQANTDANGNTNWDAVKGALAANPAGAYNLPQLTQSLTANQQANTKLNADNFDLAMKQNSFLGQRLGSIDPSDPNFQADVMRTATEFVNNYKGDPQKVMGQIADLPPIGSTPQQNSVWLQRHLSAIGSVGDQLKALQPQFTNINTGPATVAVNTNPLAQGGVGSVGYTVNNGLSPSEAAAQVPVVNADGSQGTRSKASILQQQNLGGLLPQAAQGAAGGDGRYPGNGGTVQTSPAAGVVDATQKANAAGGDQWVADQSANSASNTRINMLGNALTSLQGATTGNGADKLQAVKSLLVTLGAAPQSTVDSVQNFDEANKYLTQYAQQKAAGFGHGTDAQLAASISGNGNTHISNLAAQDVVRVNMALERMEQARTAAFQQQLDAGAVKPSDYSSWKSKFGSTMDPRVFIADQMPLAKTQAMVKSMTPQQQATFKTQYNWAAQNGYINGPQ